MTYRCVELKCPILFIIGDIKGFDALAGRYNSHNTGRISRMCDCRLAEAHHSKRRCVLTEVYTRASRKMKEGKTLPKTMLDLANASTFVHPSPAPPGEEELTSDEDVDEILQEETGSSSEGASRFFLKNEEGALRGSAIRLYLHSARTSKNRRAKVYKEVPSELIDFLVATYYNGDSSLNKPKFVDL
jgi:hypothetical protein